MLDIVQVMQFRQIDLPKFRFIELQIRQSYWQTTFITYTNAKKNMFLHFMK